MDERTSKVQELLHEAAETHHVVFECITPRSRDNDHLGPDRRDGPTSRVGQDPSPVAV